MHRFEYYSPTTLAEAASLLREKGEGGKVIAGGTDLVPQMKERGRHPKYIVSLRKLNEIRGIQFNEREGLRVGAATNMWTIRNNPVIVEKYNVIAQGTGLVGSIQTQNLATIGGNICNAAPSADGVPPFIIMGAQAHVVGPNGSRTLPLEEVFLGPGQIALERDEILAEVTVPLPQPRSAGVYIRHCPRKEMDIAVAGVGVFVALDERLQTFTHACICMSAVAPTPLRARRAEETLIGQPATEAVIERAGQIASEEARPITDLRGSASFRRHLVHVLTKKCLSQAIDKIKST